jgi:hypothetical protein
MRQKRGEEMVLIQKLKTCHILEIYFFAGGFLPISGRTVRVNPATIHGHIAEGG